MTLFQTRNTGPFPEPIVPAFPGMNVFGGMSVGLDGAMRNDAVWACVRLLAESVAMMPATAYTIRQGVRVPSQSQPELLKSPAYATTFSEWTYMTVVSLLLRGNAFSLIVDRDGQGYAKQVKTLSPDMVQVVESRDEPLKYRVNGTEVAAADMIHIRAFPIPGATQGLSPIKYAAARVLTSMDAASAFGSNFLAGGGHPSSILTTEKPLTADMATQFKEKFLSSVKNREPAVLSGGVKWESVQISPEESQFLETQKYGVTQIARIFGVPPEMIGADSGKGSITYANVTQRSLDFLVYSVQPWLTRLEEAYSALLPGAQHVRFDTSVLVRMDETTKAAVDAVRLKSGVKTINEVRASIDMAPVPWGNEPVVLDPKAPQPAKPAKGDNPETDGESDANG